MLGDLIDLVAGVGLSGAEQQPHVLGVREPLGHHGGLLLQIGKVGGAGDVAAHSAVEVVQIQRYAVGGDGRAQNRHLGGGGGRGGQRRGSVGHDEVHIGGQETIDDGGAVVALTGGILHVDLYIVAQRLLQRVHEALGSGVQSRVLRQLAHTHPVGGILGVIAGVVGRIGLAAGCHADEHDQRKEQCKQLFHGVSPFSVIQKLKALFRVEQSFCKQIRRVYALCTAGNSFLAQQK